MRKFEFVLAVMLVCGLSLRGQIMPQQAVAEMGRGINMGNTLDPPTEGAWNNPKAQESYFDAYVEAGFKTVRIPITWDKHVGTASPYEVAEVWMDRVEEIVDWALSRDMYVIMNAHHEGWLKENFPVQTNQDRFDSIWSQISVRFKDKSEKLFFEMLNEPRTGDHAGLTQIEIDDLNVRVLEIIRRTNPTRIVVYSGKGWSGSSDMMAAAIPDDPYIMASYHSYDPWSFAGEGMGTWGSTSDRSSLHSTFAKVKTWSDDNGVEVLLGESGAKRVCEYNSRMKHYAAYVEETQSLGIISTVWDDGGDFRILQRSTNSWDEVKDILIHVYPDSPTDLAISVVNDTSLKLDWTLRSADHDTIYIQRRMNDEAFVSYCGISPELSSYVDTGTVAGNYYYYRLIAAYEMGDSLYSYPQREYLEPTIRSYFSGSPFLIPGVIEAEDFDIGGEGLTYHDFEKENIPGAYRTDEGVDIEVKTSGGYHISYVEVGEWLEYTIDVAAAGTYRISVPVASEAGGGTFKFIFQNGESYVLTAPNTGSWQTFEEVSIKAELELGEQIMRVSILSIPGFNLDKFTFTDATTIDDFEEKKYSVYPNPVEDFLYVQTKDEATNASATIYTSEGKQVKFLSEIVYGAGIDVSDLFSGLYLIQIDGGLMTKFVKL